MHVIHAIQSLLCLEEGKEEKEKEEQEEEEEEEVWRRKRRKTGKRRGEKEELCTPCDLTSPNISGPPAKPPLALQSTHTSITSSSPCVSTLMN